MSSAYANFREVVAGKSLMYGLKRVGANTEPWGSPLFRCFVKLLDAPICTVKLRFVNISFNSLKKVRHLMVFRSLNSRPSLHTVSYADVKSMSTAIVFF